MSANLTAVLVSDSVTIDPTGTTMGEFKIKISFPKGTNPSCGSILVAIPTGMALSDLTNSDAVKTTFDKQDSSASFTDGSSVPDKDKKVNNITFSNSNTSNKNPDDFSFYLNFTKISINANPSGTAQRTVTIPVTFSSPFPQKIIAGPINLKLTLKNVAKETPFVGYFAADTFNASPYITPITLSWQIYNGNTSPKGMVIQPEFIGKDATNSGKAPKGVTLIKTTNPITITDAVGSLKVALVKSTQLTLIADTNNNVGTAQLAFYVNELGIVSFSAATAAGVNIPSETTVGYNQPVTLNWSVTFTNKDSTDNKLYILVTEFDAAGNPIPTLGNSPAVPSGQSATKVIEPDTVNNIVPLTGSRTVYPFRKTAYELYLEDGASGANISQKLIVLTATDKFPIGTINMVPGAAPSGWQICNGDTVNIPDKKATNHDQRLGYYNQLTIALGKGAVNAASVKLPNLKDRFVVGIGSDATIAGSTGGPDQHQHPFTVPPISSITTSNDGSHNHSFENWKDADGNAGGTKTYVDRDGDDVTTQTTGSSGDHSHTISNISLESTKTGPSTDGTTIFLNRPPWYALNFVIKVEETS